MFQADQDSGMYPGLLLHLIWADTHNRLTALCPGLTGWAGTRRIIHPLTPILFIRHPLSGSSIYYDPQHPPCSIYMLDSLFSRPHSRSSLVFLLVWDPLLHTTYIASPNHHVLFATHLILFCCSTNVMSPIPNLSFSSLLGNATHLSDHSHLCSLKCHLIFFPYMPGLTSLQLICRASSKI